MFFLLLVTSSFIVCLIFRTSFLLILIFLIGIFIHIVLFNYWVRSCRLLLLRLLFRLFVLRIVIQLFHYLGFDYVVVLSKVQIVDVWTEEHCVKSWVKFQVSCKPSVSTSHISFKILVRLFFLLFLTILLSLFLLTTLCKQMSIQRIKILWIIDSTLILLPVLLNIFYDCFVVSEESRT